MKNKKLKKWFRGNFATILVVLVSVSVYTQLSCSKKIYIIRMGAILPLTGPASEIGEWQKQGLELAVEDFNVMFSPKRIEIIYEDSKSNPKDGINAFHKIIGSDKNIPVIFSSLSSVSNAILPLINENQVNLIMLAVSLPGIAERSQWALRCNISSTDEAIAIAKFLDSETKFENFAVLYLNDEFGLGAYKTFQSEIEKFNKKILWSESYRPDQQDFRDIVSKLSNLIANNKLDGIYVIGYVKASALLIRQIREYKLDIPLFANMALTVPVYIQLAGEAIEGCYFTTNMFDSEDTSNVDVRKFVQKYKEKFGQSPTFFTTFAYDGARMLSSILDKEYINKKKINNLLTNMKNFRGVMGNVVIIPNGEMIFPVRVVKYQNQTLMTVWKEKEK